MNAVVQDLHVFRLSVLTVAARDSAGVSEYDLWRICQHALKGKTEGEPDAGQAARDIALRGFHLHAGTAWGVRQNHSRGRLELVRLIAVGDDTDPEVTRLGARAETA